MRFVFVANTSISSLVIRMVEGSPFSHAGVILPLGICEEPGERVITATWADGVSEQSLATMIASSSGARIYEVQLPNEQGAIDFVRAQVGKDYDKTGLIGLGLHRDWRDPSKWYSSELVAATLQAGGVSLAGKEDYTRVGMSIVKEVAFAWGSSQMGDALAELAGAK